jgi:hypothetical protein
MRYRSPRHRAAPPNPNNPSVPSPDGVPYTVPIFDAPVIHTLARVVFTATTPFTAPLPTDDTAALDQRAA